MTRRSPAGLAVAVFGLVIFAALPTLQALGAPRPDRAIASGGQRGIGARGERDGRPPREVGMERGAAPVAQAGAAGRPRPGPTPRGIRNGAGSATKHPTASPARLVPVPQAGHARAVAALAVRGGRLVSLDVAGGAREWDLAAGLVFRHMDAPPGPAEAVALSADGTRIAAALPGKGVVVLDLATARLLHHLPPLAGAVQALAFSRDGATVAVAHSASGTRRVALWSPARGAVVPTPEGRGDVRSLAFSPDGTRLAVALRPEGRVPDIVEIRDGRTGAVQVTLQADRTSAESACFSPDGTLIAAGSAEHTVELWDAISGSRLGAVRTGNPEDPRSEGPVREVAFSANGHALLVTSSGAGGGAMVWRWAIFSGRDADGARRLSLTPLPPLDSRGAPLRCVGVDPEGRFVAAGADSGAIMVWSANAGALARMLEPDVRLQPRAAYRADGNLAVVAHEVGGPGEGLAWDLASRHAQVTVAPSDAVTDAAFDPTGQCLAGATAHSVVTLWNARDGIVLASLAGHTASIRALGFSPRGDLLATCGAEGAVQIWDVGTRGLLQRLLGHTSDVLSLAFSPDGTLLATGGADRTVRIWNPRDASLAARIEGDETVGALTFSPDGSLVALGAGARVRVWQLGTGQQIPLMDGVEGGVTALAFAPDSSCLAVGAGDGTVSTIRLGSGATTRWRAHAGPVRALSFSRDGGRIASSGEDRCVRVFGAPSGALAYTLSFTANMGRRAWLAVDAAGRVDGNGDVGRLVAFRRGEAVHAFSSGGVLPGALDVRSMGP